MGEHLGSKEVGFIFLIMYMVVIAVLWTKLFSRQCGMGGVWVYIYMYNMLAFDISLSGSGLEVIPGDWDASLSLEVACVLGRIKTHRGPRHLKDFGAPPIYI